MLDAIRQFFSDFGASESPGRLGEDEIHVAAAALLYHVVAIDGVVSASERQLLAKLLKDRFGLDDADTAALLRAGEAADKEAVDLYGFTSLLKRRLEQADRERIIEMMWELVFVDGSLHEFEDNVIWRVAELLAVPSQTRIRLKQEVRGGPADSH
jgi:uncharacterized tellurite resistance protein B-like protein